MSGAGRIRLPPRRRPRSCPGAARCRSGSCGANHGSRARIRAAVSSSPRRPRSPAIGRGARARRGRFPGFGTNGAVRSLPPRSSRKCRAGAGFRPRCCAARDRAISGGMSANPRFLPRRSNRRRRGPGGWRILSCAAPFGGGISANGGLSSKPRRRHCRRGAALARAWRRGSGARCGAGLSPSPRRRWRCRGSRPDRAGLSNGRHSGTSGAGCGPGAARRRPGCGSSRR